MEKQVLSAELDLSQRVFLVMTGDDERVSTVNKRRRSEMPLSVWKDSLRLGDL